MGNDAGVRRYVWFFYGIQRELTIWKEGINARPELWNVLGDETYKQHNQGDTKKGELYEGEAWLTCKCWEDESLGLPIGAPIERLF